MAHADQVMVTNQRSPQNGVTLWSVVPLGMERAEKLAASLKMDKAMVLTDREFQCSIGIPPRGEDRQIVFACINFLSNSGGTTNIPLSSYGLGITNNANTNVPPGYMQSLCAPKAPCLEFNNLIDGPLERIADACEWGNKLERVLDKTRIVALTVDGAASQEFAGTKMGGACIVESICPVKRFRP